MVTKQQPWFANWTTRKQVEVSWSFILAAASLHSLVPSIRSYTRSLCMLSYPHGDGQYLQGAADALFVLGWLVLMTAIRATIIEGTYQATTWLGLQPKKSRMRFAEQGYLLFYDGTSFTLGMHLLMNSSYWLNFEELWSTWPSRQISGELKWYYLVQLSFWLQQILAINLEKRRKDYLQMSTHHVITSVLIYISYAYRWTKVGHVVLTIMDVVDFLLPLAKMLKYLHFEATCTVMFGLFMATWLFARHGIYNILWYSIYRDVPRVMPFACYDMSSTSTLSSPLEIQTDPAILSSPWRYLEPFFNQAGTICLDQSVKGVFLAMLGMLQLLSIVWFGMIVRVAVNMLRGKGAHDERSGDEDEASDEECEEDEEEESELGIEVEEKGTSRNGKMGKNGKMRLSPPPRASAIESMRQNGLFQRGAAGRIRVPGSRDRKELIGRVGCNG